MTARSQTLRAWLTNLCFISMSAYLSHTVVLPEGGMEGGRGGVRRVVLRSREIWVSF